MTAFNNYEVIFSDRTGETDITSSVMGFQVDSRAGVAEMGHSVCRVTLKNYDGAFIPAEGGGTGTYSNVDWRTKRLVVNADTSFGTAYAFDGVITNISFTDNGVYSTAEITAHDWLKAATGAPGTINAGTSPRQLDDVFSDAINGPPATYGPGVELPKFDGSVQQEATTFLLGTSPNVERPALSNTTAFDLINNVILPSGPVVHFPGPIVFATSPPYPFDANIMISYLVGPPYDKPNTYLTTNIGTEFAFNENPSAATEATTELPFTGLVTGFDNAAVTNQTTATSLATGTTTQTSTDQTSIDKYGIRTRNYSTLVTDTDTELKAVTDFWTKRQSTGRYSARRLTTKLSTIEQECGTNAGKQLHWLFSMIGAMWGKVKLTATPTGGVSTVTGHVIYRRIINATPSDTTITLELLPGADYQSFVLDSDVLGVLDQNRLG